MAVVLVLCLVVFVLGSLCCESVWRFFRELATLPRASSPEFRPVRITPAPVPSTVEPGPELASSLFQGLPPDEPEALNDESRLLVSVNRLREAEPHLSADHTLSRPQRQGLLDAAGILLVAGLILGHNLIVLIMASILVIYLAMLGLRLYLFRIALIEPDEVRISDAEALAVPDHLLPVYTVLVPAFREPEVLEPLIANLRGLDYPANRLDIKLLLEADDDATVTAARSLIRDGDEGVEVVLVAPGEPRTKPKALNYGLTLARGQIVTIYDAEDRPDPLQLRKAAIALGRAPETTACIQAKLAFFNPHQNLITKWFDTEYRMWFSQMLPGLVHVGAPVPLGGTSNHFRRSVLVEVGGWDPFNVTEDADLGIRLHRRGYATAMLDSTTLEEANSDFVNWIKQRSRWYKGYLQTWLVHIRRPRELLRDLGWKGFLLFNLFVAGTPLLAILNPVFWLMTVLWFVGHPSFIASLFPAPVYYAGLLCWLAGNFVFLYACILSAYESEQPKVTLAAALMPLYWGMMSLAAIKAGVQIVMTPSYWEKTHHGLTL